MADGYDKILAATDMSPESIEGLTRAADLALRLDAELVVVYVAEDRLPPMVLAASSEPAEKILERHVQTAEEGLRKLSERHLPGRDVRTVVVQGTPHEAVVEFAREESVDLIVVGTRGHGLIGHALMGSTTERILHHAPCPVLVVRMQE